MFHRLCSQREELWGRGVRHQFGRNHKQGMNRSTTELISYRVLMSRTLLTFIPAWSPISTSVTKSPFATTTPAPSWPPTRGSFVGIGQSPLIACRSVWQTPEYLILTSTSSGPGFATTGHQHVFGTWETIQLAWYFLVFNRASSLLDDLGPLLLWDVLCHCILVVLFLYAVNVSVN